MCVAAAAVPLIIEGVSVAATMAAAGAEYAAQQAQAHAQQSYENTLYSENKKNVLGNLSQQYAGVQNQINQQTAATQQQGTQNALAAQAAEGTAKTMQGARGVTGRSAQEALLNFQRIEAGNNATLQTNLNWAKAQGYQQELSYQAQAKTAIASATPAPVAQPSAAALGLSLFGTGLNGADKMYQMANPQYGAPPPAPGTT